MLERCSPQAALLTICISIPPLCPLLHPRSHRSGFTKGEPLSLWGNKKPHVANKKSGMNWGSQWIWLVLVWYVVICSKSVCSSPPCAPRAFPWECGLLFRTPGIASGVLLVRLMWAKQRGNKEYGNLQIIAELKTSRSFTQARKTLSLAQRQTDTWACGHILPVLQSWTCRVQCAQGAVKHTLLGGSKLDQRSF